MITPNQFKKGMKIEVKGEPYILIDFQHIKMGRGGATVRTKLKSLLTNNVIEKTFRSNEKIDVPNFEEKELHYLYNDGDFFYFMDNESFEQFRVSKEVIGDSALFLVENIDVTIQFYNGEPIGVILPNFIDVEVVKTEPGLKGDTVSGGTKPAKIASGATIQVPLFINEGDIIKVDTRSGDYVERVKIS
ncbi:MAG: elongation factor P [Deferribacterota bacterium]|nr:elongation factor P [Deferribacterota bacterium]